MRYLSVCAGIEAASCAWHPLGWTAAAYSEIEAFPRAVLAHHYPKVPLHGDFTTIRGDEYGPIDLLVGGTPCQDFSVAGLRAGLDGERGNLTLEFVRLADRTKPDWVVWENVPGVLSIDGGRAFGAFLGGLAQLGYGFAYRVLDAQYFGLAQRRARVFVVGHLGDWRRAAAVLFERESLRWDSPPRREAGEGIANSLTERPDRGGGNSEGQRLIPEISMCLNAGGMGRQDSESETLIAHSLRAEGFDASEDGTGRGTPIVPISTGYQGDRLINENSIAPCLPASSCNNGGGGGGAVFVPLAFSAKDHGADAGEISPTLRSGGHDKSHANGGVMPAVAFEWRRGATQNLEMLEEQAPALIKSQTPAIQATSAVRRLTPRECERLQGFKDDYTLVPYRGKPAADGPRYKALGNSMAVPVMSWIGRRIAMVQSLSRPEAA